MIITLTIIIVYTIAIKITTVYNKQQVYTNIQNKITIITIITVFHCFLLQQAWKSWRESPQLCKFYMLINFCCTVCHSTPQPPNILANVNHLQTVVFEEKAKEIIEQQLQNQQLLQNQLPKEMQQRLLIKLSSSLLRTTTKKNTRKKNISQHNQQKIRPPPVFGEHHKSQDAS